VALFLNNVQAVVNLMRLGKDVPEYPTSLDKSVKDAADHNQGSHNIPFVVKEIFIQGWLTSLDLPKSI
jgi:hypothetical protein